MADIFLKDLPNGIRQATSPSASGEVSVIDANNLVLPRVGTPVAGTDGANKDFVDTAVSDLVTGPGSAVDENIATFNTTTGKLIQDSGSAIPSAGIGDVTGPASAVDGNLASYDTTTGKLIKDSGVASSDLITAASSLTLDDMVIGSGGQGLETTNFVQIDTTDNQVLINQAILKDTAIYNFAPTFSFNPSTISTTWTQYIGTFSTNKGVVEIVITDEGNAHFSSSSFRVSRAFGENPVLYFFTNGNSNSTYKIFYRTLGDDEYELFFADNSTVNFTITYQAFISTQGNLAAETVSATNDTGIVQTKAGIIYNQDSSVRIVSGLMLDPLTVNSGDFSGGNFNISNLNNSLKVASFTANDTLTLFNITSFTDNGTALVITDISGTCSQSKPLIIVGNFQDGRTSYSMVHPFAALYIIADSTTNDEWMIISEYPVSTTTDNTIRSVQDMKDKYTLSLSDFIIPDGVDLNPVGIVDLTGFSIRPAPGASIGILGSGSNQSGFTTSTPGASNIPLIFQSDASNIIVTDCQLSATGTDGEVIVQNHPQSTFQMLNNVSVFGLLNISDFGLFASTSSFLLAAKITFLLTPTGQGAVKILQTNANPSGGTFTITVNSGVTIPLMTLTEFGGVALTAGVPGNGQFLSITAGGFITNLQLVNNTFSTTSPSAFQNVDETSDFANFIGVQDNTTLRNSTTNGFTLFEEFVLGTYIIVAIVATDVFQDISDAGANINWVVGSNVEKFSQTNSNNGQQQFNGVMDRKYKGGAVVDFERIGGQDLTYEFAIAVNGTVVDETRVAFFADSTNPDTVTIPNTILDKISNGDIIKLQVRNRTDTTNIAFHSAKLLIS